jgi:hypothetical protein
LAVVVESAVSAAPGDRVALPVALGGRAACPAAGFRMALRPALE